MDGCAIEGPADHSVTVWLRMLQAGDQEGAQRLWGRYFAGLVEMARNRMRGLSLRVTDEEDVALSAFDTFCRAATAGRFPRLSGRDDLWQLLLMLTARKTVDLRRHQQRQKRGDNQLDQPLMPDEVIGHEPDPQFAAQVAEEFDHLLKQLNDRELQDLAVYKLEGFSNEEVAKKLQCSLRSVERKLAVIRGVWEEAGPNAEIT